VKKRWLAAAILAIIAAVPLFCIAIELAGNPGYGEGSVIFLEHKTSVRGRLVNGTYPARSLSEQGYWYDPGQKVLAGLSLPANGSIKAILGVSRSLMQDAGDGTASEAHGIYSLPWRGAEGITLEAILPDGTVTLTYNGSQITLAPGERWERVTTEIVEAPEYSIRLIKGDAIRNNGALSRPSIA
jgi:hypothetical protein